MLQLLLNVLKNALKKKPAAPPPPDGDMSVIEHLDELRTRIIICLVVWGAASVGVWYYAHAIFAVVCHALPPNMPIYVTKVQEAFMTYLKVAIIGGGLLAAPVLVWQLLLFVLPALTPTEKRAVVWIVPFGLVLFVGGVAFSMTLVLPTAIHFLLSFTGVGSQLQTLLDANEYLMFVASLAMMCGLVFEMPLLFLFLGFIGLISAAMLSAYRRYAYFGCFAISAIMTPTPDAFTMIIVALPMLLLYEVSIILVRLLVPKRAETPSVDE